MKNWIPYNSFESGNTYKFYVKNEQYDSKYYGIKYVFKANNVPAKTFELTRLPDGSHFASISCEDWPAELYTCAIYSYNEDGERQTIATFSLTVRPDLATSDDPRTYNQKCLDAINFVLSGQCSNSYLETVFHNATFKYKTTYEILRLKNYFEREVDKENGINPGRLIQK